MFKVRITFGAPRRVADALTPLRVIFEEQVEEMGKLLEKHDNWLPLIFKYAYATCTIEENHPGRLSSIS